MENCHVAGIEVCKAVFSADGPLFGKEGAHALVSVVAGEKVIIADSNDVGRVFFGFATRATDSAMGGVWESAVR